MQDTQIGYVDSTKSRAEVIEERYAGVVSREREAEILTGQRYSQDTDITEVIGTMKAEEAKMASIGLEESPELVKRFYAVLDKIGLDSAERRLDRQIRAVELHSRSAKKAMQECGTNIGTVCEGIKEMRLYRRDAKKLYLSNKQKLEDYHEEIGKIKDDKEKIRAQLGTEPKNGELIQAYDNADVELIDLEEKVRETETDLDQVGNQIVVAGYGVRSLERKKTELDAVHMSLRERYNELDRIRGELGVFRGGSNGNVLGILNFLIQSGKICEYSGASLRVLKNSSVVIEEVLSKANLNAHDRDENDNNRTHQELEKINKGRRSKTRDLAEREINKDDLI